MGTHKDITDNHRAAIARGWASSGLTQDEYARLHGIRSRTLREYLRKHAAPRDTDQRALEIIEKAIADLTAIRAAIQSGLTRHPAAPASATPPTHQMEASSEQARHAVGPANEAPLRDQMEPLSELAHHLADGHAPTTSGPPPRPTSMRRPKDFFNDVDDVEAEPI